MLPRCLLAAASPSVLLLCFTLLWGAIPSLGQGTAEGRPAALERLADYVGLWRTEDRVDSGGNPFRFELEQRWLDPHHTIVELTIRRLGTDGATVIFRGFKGREPEGDGVYYVAASPSGRGARGSVILEGENLVIAYEGWEAGGPVVEVRDVFEPVSEDGRGFVSRTFLRSEPAADWRRVAEDRWRRVEDRGDG